MDRIYLSEASDAELIAELNDRLANSDRRGASSFPRGVVVTEEQAQQARAMVSFKSTRGLWLGVPSPAEIQIGGDAEVRINGTFFVGAIFDQLGDRWTGGWFQVQGRDDRGVVTLRSVAPLLTKAFDVLASAPGQLSTLRDCGMILRDAETDSDR